MGTLWCLSVTYFHLDWLCVCLIPSFFFFERPSRELVRHRLLANVQFRWTASQVSLPVCADMAAATAATNQSSWDARQDSFLGSLSRTHIRRASMFQRTISLRFHTLAVAPSTGVHREGVVQRCGLTHVRRQRDGFVTLRGA